MSLPFIERLQAEIASSGAGLTRAPPVFGRSLNSTLKDFNNFTLKNFLQMKSENNMLKKENQTFSCDLFKSEEYTKELEQIIQKRDDDITRGLEHFILEQDYNLNEMKSKIKFLKGELKKKDPTNSKMAKQLLLSLNEKEETKTELEKNRKKKRPHDS